jgi:hypothetical protein
VKSIRHFAVVLTMSAVSMFPIQARSQQEVAPDHFDEPVARVAKQAPAGQMKSAHHSQRHHHTNSTGLAAKRGGNKGRAHSRPS